MTLAYPIDLTGSYENWRLIPNVVNYFLTRTKGLSPYLRMQQASTTGSKTTPMHQRKNNGTPEPSTLAYQTSLGANAKFNLFPRAVFLWKQVMEIYFKR